MLRYDRQRAKEVQKMEEKKENKMTEEQFKDLCEAFNKLYYTIVEVVDNVCTDLICKWKKDEEEKEECQKPNF